ncbi:type VI secretion system baseplate subunit TssE [Leptolyngbya sp. 7M]|uniref:type VI secretion system baseplate subunit TssE n=1 Tax=Leptolyngbya sp. 7M TaxID=2812896 RepID=UPI001B8D93E1|nr:type VI secretion system baseplate subunit TssE [Leptolyngbya sp. 7M]QYO65263.1 type VI secretion system baseplate subunit TssE [Leptolyngbya sp. 7M]
MARIDQEIRLTPSVLDRLIDLDPRSSVEAPKSRSASLRDLRDAVRRDLEWLLNTRCHTEALDDQLEEAPSSVAFYGLPDFTGLAAKNSGEQKRIAGAVEAAIKHFEPRFLDVKVSLQPISNLDRQLKFHIEAQLDVEPTPEPIAFDTVLELGSGEFVLKES